MMGRSWRIGLLTLGLASFVGLAQEAAGPTLVRVMFGNTGSPELHQEIADAFMAENPGIEIELLEGPEQTDDLLALYLEFFNAESNEIDVLQMDVTWPGFMENFVVDLNQYGAQDVVAQHMQNIVDNNTVNGKLLAIPWFTDAGILFYREDLLDKYGYDGPPASWAALEEMAATIQEGERQENQDFWGFVWQGNAYEGLTVDALEWVASHGGGTILDEEGNITINNASAVAAFERAASWVDTISPPGVTGFNEEAARNFFQAGNAAFMRNWPYAFALSNGEGSPIAGNVGIARLPAGEGGESTSVLGGWSLAVSEFSDNPEAAAKVALYFAAEEAQKKRSVEGSYTPTIESLFEDPDVLAANPFYDLLQDVLDGATVRPGRAAGPNYFEVSRSFYNAAYDLLTSDGEADVEEALIALELQLQEDMEEAP